MRLPAEAAVGGKHGPTDHGREARQHLTTVPFAGHIPCWDHQGFIQWGKAYLAINVRRTSAYSVSNLRE
jgi:hypothetical protein